MEIIASWPADMPLRDVASWAHRVEGLGFDVMHVPETIHDPFTVAALALANTERLVVRTSMVVAFPRSPMLTAYAAWDLAKFSEGRFELGIASQVRGNIVGRFSTEWSEPVARLADYVRSLRAIFDAFQTGGALDYQGAHYRFDRLQPYFNPGPLEHSPPTIWTGGVNRKMCVLAGEQSDGFVCHPTNSHPEVLRALTLPAIAEGRVASERPSPCPRVVAGPQPTMAAGRGDLEELREKKRSELAFLYSTPAYRPQLAVFGAERVGETLTEMASRGDWSGLDQCLDDELLGVLVPEGTYDEIPGILNDWYADLCHGIVLAVPADLQDDVALAGLVADCRTIPAAGRLTH